MEIAKKKILIVDEAGFTRICSAILEKEGYGTSAALDIHQFDSECEQNDIGLVITSYPYGAHLIEKLKKRKIPTIILSDHMGPDLMAALDHFDRTLSHCMIKPLDYHKFRAVVNEAMKGTDVTIRS